MNQSLESPPSPGWWPTISNGCDSEEQRNELGRSPRISLAGYPLDLRRLLNRGLKHKGSWRLRST